MTSPLEAPTCKYCGTPLWKGPDPVRSEIERHLGAHAPLKPCLGTRADGCRNRTNAYESDSPGYCLACANDPSWKVVSDRVLPGKGAHGRLELNGDGDGLRHFLNGRAVHAGDLLEFLLEDGRWVPGRYEWTFVGDDPPRFHIELGSDAPDEVGSLPEAVIQLPDQAVLRWPPGSGGKGK